MVRPIVAVALLVAGCDGGAGAPANSGGGDLASAPGDAAGASSAAMCMLPPCGGDLTGTWRYASECPAAASWCNVVNASYAATVTFNADMTYSLTQSCDGDHSSACNCAVMNYAGSQSGTYTYFGCSGLTLNPQSGGDIALGVRMQANKLILSFANDRHFTTFIKQ